MTATRMAGSPRQKISLIMAMSFPRMRINEEFAGLKSAAPVHQLIDSE
jgi:hypothetical protein